MNGENKDNNVVINEEVLLNKFFDEIKYYAPNYEKIVYANQYGEKLSENEIYERKLESFCTNMRLLRKNRRISAETMGERLSCTKQNISKIENKKIKKIPINNLEFIHSRLDVSIAFLLGLTPDDGSEPSLTEYYFWEHPESEFVKIRHRIGQEKPLSYAMDYFGKPSKKIIESLIPKLEKDYELLSALDDILSAQPEVRKANIEIIKNLSKILLSKNRQILQTPQKHKE